MCDVDFPTARLEALSIAYHVASRVGKPEDLSRFDALRYRRRDVFGRAVDSGTGACMFKKGKTSWADGFFTWSPCHGYTPWGGNDKRRPKSVPMCPRTVPLAVALVHKAATTSVINWISSMELLSFRVAHLIGRLTDCVCAGGGNRVQAAFNENLEGNASIAHSTAIHLAMPFLHYLYHDANTPAHANVMRSLMPLLGSCEDAWPPAMYCPSCCTPTTHPQRLHVTVVRNPYERFASAYIWMRGDPRRFPGFVEAIHGLWRRDPVLFEDPSSNSDRRVPFDWDWGVGFGRGRSWLHGPDLYHLRCAYFEIAESFSSVSPLLSNASARLSSTHLNSFNAVLDSKASLGDASLGLRVHALHLESLETDFQVLEDTLCREFNFCATLPPLRVLNQIGKSQWREYWGSQTARFIWEMSFRDFAAFGYSDDPKRRAPLTDGPSVIDLKMPRQFGSKRADRFASEYQNIPW